MTEVMLMKGPGGVLVPADEGTRATIVSWPAGQGVRAEVKRVRNVGFHRKFFAMLQLAYDSWDPLQIEYGHGVATKNFERFRKDLIVLAGFYITTVNLKGEVRLEAESMSFAAMDEDRFNLVYGRVVDVVLTRVLRNYSREDLDRVVEQMLGFM